MLPDEPLRLEARQFTALNRGLLMTMLWRGLWLLIALVLLPLAVTMALLWKTKEVVFPAVFGAGRDAAKMDN